MIFTEIKEDREFLARSLSAIFKDSLKILAVGKDDLHQVSIVPKAVLVTESSCDTAISFFTDSIIVFAERTITGHNLEKITMLPTNTNALVVNSPKECAIETVNSMISLGINHLNLIPYWPGSDLDISFYDIVIYTGFEHHCPPNKATYINIGYRHLTFSTIARIISIYNLSTEYIDDFHNNYAKIIINNTYRINTYLQETKQLKDNFEWVCNLSNNVIITIDDESRITIFNSAAESFFNAKRKEVLGTSYQKCFEQYPQLVEFISNNSSAHDSLLNINNQAVSITLTKININNKKYTLLSMTPVAVLQGTEARVRAKLHQKGFSAKYNFQDIKGKSLVLQKTIDIAKRYATCDATVLLLGESGTGKELFAHSIHNASSRSKAPFVGINFAALPENLAESELFGYEEGAFTGASKGGKSGLFEIAHLGTIFLDEIADASLSMQTRLLRILEEREIIRVGSSRIIPVDVRIICATNKDLQTLIKEGKFREDLYYRIRFLPLRIPALRERKEDIHILINHFSEQFNIRNKLPNRLLNRIIQYDWPGNIRELKSIIQYFSLLESSDLSEIHDESTPYDDLLESFFHKQSSLNNDSFELFFNDPMQRELLAILKVINSANQKAIPIGRYSLAKNRDLYDLGLTETKIKIRLKKLEAYGLVSVGKTRQGVYVTSAGSHLIELYQSDSR